MKDSKILMAVYLQNDGHLIPISWDEEPRGERIYLDGDGLQTTVPTGERLYRPYEGYDEARSNKGRRVFVHTIERDGEICPVEVYEASDIPVREGHVMYPAIQSGDLLLPWEPINAQE